jgi:hypothetical protein
LACSISTGANSATGPPQNEIRDDDFFKLEYSPSELQERERVSTLTGQRHCPINKQDRGVISCR